VTPLRLSPRLTPVVEVLQPLLGMFIEAQSLIERAGPDVCDFLAGNPQEQAMPPYVEALQRWAQPEPDRRDWFAYIQNDPTAQQVVSAYLREQQGLAFEPEDIAMTNAAIAALAVVLRTIAGDGDEVIMVSPPHFLYEPLIRAAGAEAVRVKVHPTTFDLDPEDVRAAITPRTRALILNSPHNPTGRIFPEETLEALGRVLTEASERQGDPIYLLSDEAYSRILFDGRSFVPPAAYYPNTFVIYSYGKQLLAPGQRIGFIALPPTMPKRKDLMLFLMAAQLITGWAWPNALLQHGLVDLDPLSVDMDKLQWRRDHMVASLRDMGYRLHVPEATFYLMVQSPIEDDWAFFRQQTEDGVLVLPGTMLEMPGTFRISLTASDDMIERALPLFANAFKRATE
jgi:aspartate aminotransferase